ncbi:hypothetical protein DR91_2082 [Neisseria lactamica ATCC 23970]|nr:hypothetical protein DR91_2082 [Neisseria lactamica ATCC 23970]
MLQSWLNQLQRSFVEQKASSPQLLFESADCIDFDSVKAAFWASKLFFF